MIRVSRHSILRDRADKPRFIKDTFPFLFAVTLVAAAIVVPYSIASISLLDNGGDTLKGSRIDDVKEKAIGTAVSYGESSTSPVPVQTKSSSSSDADNTASSTPVPPPSGVRSEEIVAEPALMLTPDRKAGATAIETSHGSTQGPSTVQTAPSELSAPQERIAPPVSTADSASATAIETSHGSTQGRSTVETAPPELSVPQEVSAQPASIADSASAAQRAAAVTIPLAISDEERDQMFRDFKIQRNGHTNLDQGTAAERSFDATYSRGAPPLRHATAHRQDAAEAEHNITRKLNRLELSRLLSRQSRNQTG